MSVVKASSNYKVVDEKIPLLMYNTHINSLRLKLILITVLRTTRSFEKFLVCVWQLFDMFLKTFSLMASV